jgi:uncharacterized protein Smg (DUF494 family)
MSVGSRDFNPEGKPCGVRHLHASEAVRLSTDAQQMLLKLVEEGIISPLHFEKAIEYLWANDLRQVSLSRLELVLLLTKPDGENEEEAYSSLSSSMSLH